MIVTVENQSLDAIQIKNGDFHGHSLNTENTFLLEFMRQWMQNTLQFSFHSSGSTGKPKKIVIDREVMFYSARETLKYLGLEKAKGTMLLCLTPTVIGGAMVAVRAMVSGQNLEVLPANTQFSTLNQSTYTLTSLVPLQVKKILGIDRQIFRRFKNILVGGASLPKKTENELSGIHANAYHTYGMTETASHVAIRKLNSTYFEAVGDNEFSQHGNKLKLRGTVTRGEWLITNDVVHLKDNRRFKWLGRSDFIINSGGFKIDPEKVEGILAPQLDGPFAVSSLPDAKLGEQLVLAAYQNPMEMDYNQLHSYERPKQVFWNQEIPLTASGKIDRIRMKEILLNK